MIETPSLLSRRPALPRIVPFASYMLFVGGGELAAFLGAPLTPAASALLYPFKAGLVLLCLCFCLPHCRELKLADLLNPRLTAFSIGVGLAVFVLWPLLDLPWARIGSPPPFAPDAAPEGLPSLALLACRFAGAAVLVPLAEELFWRSWLIRALENKDFQAVEPGNSGLFAFVAVAALFALEHNMLLSGLMAGLAYNIVLRHTRSVAHCVLAHAVTNAALGVWVVQGGRWMYW